MSSTHIVQQAGLEADHVHVHLGQQAGDLERMNDVRLAGDAGLAFVAACSEAVGLFERGEVLAGPSGAHAWPSGPR